jgi:hypothetical protein
MSTYTIKQSNGRYFIFAGKVQAYPLSFATLDKAISLMATLQ